MLDPLTTVTVQGKHTGPVRMLKPLPGWVALTFAASANTLETYECHYQAAMPQLGVWVAKPSLFPQVDVREFGFAKHHHVVLLALKRHPPLCS